MRGAKKLIVLSTRVDEDVAAKLKRLADAKEWTTSKYIERLIKQHVQEAEPEPKAKKPEKPAKEGRKR
jgi:predicted transcriptional regulator